MPAGPLGVAFDGTHLWVACQNAGVVVQMRPSDGKILAAFNAGTMPSRVAYDGAYIWVTSLGANAVTSISAATGTLNGTYAVGPMPLSLAFDGSSIWIVNAGNNTVTRLRAKDGVSLGTTALENSSYAQGAGPIVYDGVDMWVNDSVALFKTPKKQSPLRPFPVQGRLEFHDRWSASCRRSRRCRGASVWAARRDRSWYPCWCRNRRRWFRRCRANGAGAAGWDRRH